jgi:hypothetical protein
MRVTDPDPTDAATDAAPRRSRWRTVWRWTWRVLLVVVLASVALVITFFSVDLGPSFRQRAEQEATKYLERPMHIGKLKARIWPGTYELENVVIEGPTPSDLPFLSAGRIKVSLTWRSLLQRAGSRTMFASVEMTDWKMHVDTGRGRKPSIPKLTPKNPSSGPPPFTTTVRVFATRGQFSYTDHDTPWSVVAPNLNFNLVRADNLKKYVGTAHFDRGTVKIQNYLPMSAEMTTRFSLDGGARVQLDHIDLITDGARSSVTGEVYFSDKWPEQTYHVKSRINFPRMRELFFANEAWRIRGDANFEGIFRLPKAGGRVLAGTFTSALATLDTSASGTRLTFPNLNGRLEWLPTHFAVTEASADFYGGRADFSYALLTPGNGKPATATFVTDYDNVDLQTFATAINWQSMELVGRATGHQEMSWQNGRLRPTYAASGQMTLVPPAGAELASAALDRTQPVVPAEPGVFQGNRPLGPLPVGGEIAYRLDPAGIVFSPSWVSSPMTYVGFRGRADYGAQSALAFHVTSRDWQSSDRLLAAILTASGAPTGAVPVGGFGEFDGVMTGPFSQPRIAGRFDGEHVRSWDVAWGRAVGDIVIERGTVTVKNGRISRGPDQQIVVDDGRFALGFRKAGEDGEELKDARIRVVNWPLEDFRKAFNLNDWPVTGTVGAADIRLNGPYRGPAGEGTLRIDRGTAWGERFDVVNGKLTFSGAGLEISQIVMAKDVGQITGTAVIQWDGTYAFDAAGSRIPVESLDNFKVPMAPLSGVLQFTASGEGEFASPRYTFRATIPDLSAGNQGVGAVSAVLEVRNNTLYIPQMEAHSVLVQVSGSGSIALNDTYDGTLNFRFTNSRIDPYLPLLAPRLAEKISQYTRAVVGGTVQVQGELKNPAALAVFATVDEADLTLFDYKLRNEGQVRMTFENNAIGISRLVVSGAETRLSIEGTIPLSDEPINLTAAGQANLAVLQLLSSPDIASSGAATVNARIGGTVQALTLSGQADIVNGRIRYRNFPHGIEQIDGPLRFDSTRVTVDNVRAQLGAGDVIFSGAIHLQGLVPDRFDLRAEGRSMALRFPTGFLSRVNASLTLTGPVAAPTLGGDVTVIRSYLLQEIESQQALLALGTSFGPAGGVAGAPGSESAMPLKLDVRIDAPARSLMINTPGQVEIFGRANIEVRGTIDNPSITGPVTLDTGYVTINANRWTLLPSTIDFFNPSQIQPVFDVTAQTRARAPGQAYDVTLRITGEPSKLNLELNSVPPLPFYSLVNLIAGERYDPNTLRDAELNELRSPQLAQQQAMATIATQVLAMPVSSAIGNVVQRAIPCDAFSIIPLLGNQANLQDLTPGARVTCGKRLSERVFFTWSRALNATRQYDLILVEYEQSDRTSWVLSRNEDRTFALDFRIRRDF